MSQTAQLEDQFTAHLIAQGKTFCWHQVYGATEQSSIDFYTQALGWTTDAFPMGENGTYKVLVANGCAVAGVVGTEEAQCEMMQGVPPHWSVSIATDDVDARAEKCVSLGGKVLQGPFDIPTVGRMALVQDPQGAQFWLFKGQAC